MDVGVVSAVFPSGKLATTWAEIKYLATTERVNAALNLSYEVLI